MITYVINTSENRTFDSDQLFKLAGYKKIQWLNVHLDEVNKCIEYIKKKQGAIESEEFRVAVVVDFFGYDRIRIPYGREGYFEDKGVEWSMYLPYIEAYLNDRLFYALEKQELFSASYEVFYIKGGSVEVIENIDNLKDQVDQVVYPNEESGFKGVKKCYVKDYETVYESADGNVYTLQNCDNMRSKLDELNKRLYENLSKSEKEKVIEEIQVLEDSLDIIKTKKIEVKKVNEEKTYSEFNLYCTPNLSLKFDIYDYPYIIEVNKGEGVSTRQFFEAFHDRSIKSKRIHRYFHSTSLGGSPAKAAFENLALYLNLVRLYEREDSFKEDGLVDVSKIDPNELRDLLLNSWNKIVKAKKVAKENNSFYYSLKSIFRKEPKNEKKKKESPEEEFSKVRARVVVPNNEVKDSIDKQFDFILSMGKKGENIFIDEDKKEFDEILSKYLKKRNEVTEQDIEDDFKDKIKTDRLEKTNQCPPKQELDFVIGQKEDEISNLMAKVLEAEYSVQKFEEEQKSAKKYYEKYLEAKKVLQRGTIGDIIFLILTLATVLVPYIVGKSITGFSFGTIMTILLCSGTFLGLFILSFLIAVLPSIKKMNKMKRLMYECYKDCLTKKKIALLELRRRYEVDLIAIEELRYEIRQVLFLYEFNLKKDKNIDKHRKTLDDLENCLGTILNNLGVHPVIDNNVIVEREFNMLKPIFANENKIYKVFSLDAIESLLIKDDKGVR